MIYELHVHQAELEIQNEELQLTRQEMENLRNKYFDLYEFAPVGYFSIDKNGLIKEANLAAAKMLNTERRALIKAPFSQFVAPDHRGIFRFYLGDIFKNRGAKTFEIKLSRLNSTEWYVLLECVTEYDESKNIAGLRVAVVDIHERKILEQELARSEQRYRHIVENAPSGIYEVDFEKMQFISANQAALNITGHRADEIAAMNPLDLLIPESRKRFIKRLAKMQRGETPPAEVEFEIYKKNGETTWVLLNAQFHKQNGMIGKATVVVHDIQDRKELENKLKESERRFRALADNAPDIIVRYDKELRHLYVSPIIESITGIPSEQFVGKTNEELGMPANLCKKWNKFLKKIYQTGKPGKLEFDFTGPDEAYCFEMRAMPEFSEDDQIESIMCITRNITELKTILAERKRLLSELKNERARLKAIISHAPQGIVVTDKKAQIIMANTVADQLYGVPVPCNEPYDSQALPQLFDEKGRPIPRTDYPAVRSALDGETFINKELLLKNTIGELRHLLVNSSPIRGLNGYISGAVCVFQDITERKKAQQKESMDKAHQYGRDILETVHNPIILLDAELKVVMANRSFYWIFKESPGQTIGRYLYELGNRQWDIPELRRILEDILPHKTTLRDYIVDHHFKKIGRRIMKLNAHKMRSTIGQEEKIVLSMQDITEQKLAELEQLEYQQKLRALAQQLTDSEEKERQRIASGLHDSVVQSLTAARIKLAIAQDSKTAEINTSQFVEVDEIIGEVIDDIRSLSFELSAPMLHTVGLKETIEWFADQVSKKHDISIIVKDNGVEEPLTENIKNVLFQAVRELLSNTLKHAYASQVTIVITELDGNIQIEFKDNGIGFDTTQLFSAIDKSKGFGLFNLRERLDYVKGKISVESQIGKGTQVVLTAPLMKGATD